MMTGKELIIYILENNLLDKPVFDGERFIGYLTEGDAAEKLKVGLATLDAMLDIFEVECVNINGVKFIPHNFMTEFTHLREE